MSFQPSCCTAEPPVQPEHFHEHPVQPDGRRGAAEQVEVAGQDAPGLARVGVDGVRALLAAALDEEGYDARVVAFANDYGIEVREQDMGDRLGWLARYE